MVDGDSPSPPCEGWWDDLGLGKGWGRIFFGNFFPTIPMPEL